MSELKHTPLHAVHVGAGARMAPFGGWQLPVAYGSQIEEHHAVRRAAGMFDVSHMTIVDVTGAGARAYLEWLLANDVGKLDHPRGDADCAALYTCMLDPLGGILDDLIVYRFTGDSYRLIVNAATREKDLAWLGKQAAGFDVALAERADLALVAVQGPEARRIAAPLVPGGADVMKLPPFSARRAGEWLLARTGYTGEDGLEIMLPQQQAEKLWCDLQSRDVTPCGLGARDTLRLEAGMNLYGQDMDESVTPLECGLGWTVDFGGNRAFSGREALEERLRAGSAAAQVGVILDSRGVLRAGYEVITAAGEGLVTSGTFSPTLGRAIGLARVQRPVRVQGVAEGPGHVFIRGHKHPVRVVKPPFVRNGRILVDLEQASQKGDRHERNSRPFEVHERP